MQNYVNVYYQPLADVPPHIFKQLYRLNMRDDGCMQRLLRRARLFPNEHKDSTVFYIKGTGDIIKGWALVTRGDGGRYSKPKREVHFYVRRKERKNGYGTALADIVKQEFKNKRLSGYVTHSSIFKRHNIRDVFDY